jgi:hypothetical protein
MFPYSHLTNLAGVLLLMKLFGSTVQTVLDCPKGGNSSFFIFTADRYPEFNRNRFKGLGNYRCLGAVK